MFLEVVMVLSVQRDEEMIEVISSNVIYLISSKENVTILTTVLKLFCIHVLKYMVKDLFLFHILLVKWLSQE